MPQGKVNKTRDTTACGSPLAASSPIRTNQKKPDLDSCVQNSKSSLNAMFQITKHKIKAFANFIPHVRNIAGDKEFCSFDTIEDDCMSIRDCVIKAFKTGSIENGHSIGQSNRNSINEMPPPRTVVPKKKMTRGRSAVPKINKMSTRKLRSSRSLSNDKKLSSNTFETPARNQTPYRVAAVTPSIKCQTPGPIYRKPIMGEQVISMSGSPLMVPLYSDTEEPQLHIPLLDGRVFAVMPQENLENVPNFTNIDPVTIEKLKRLHQFLQEKVLK
ncbi:uncharacterized protein LOC106668701 [Cimex lectularius]|uniref:Borealin C-terminal domain-containing protein n=1 Tax=Cimex lectularius TaxID=79782 RepID=A0A8I6RYE6_CIMLE|nr:uncharacterized protein LOC106668701 [Cimex lectularius]